MSRKSRTTAGLVLASLLALLIGATSALSDPFEPHADHEETNSIEVVVDGKARKTWTVGELMRGRFDWLSPNGTFFPAVPVTFALVSPPLEIDLESIAAIRFRSQKTAVELAEGDLDLLQDLLFKVDLERGGTWQLVGRDEMAEERLIDITGIDRLRRVLVIEVELESRE